MECPLAELKLQHSKLASVSYFSESFRVNKKSHMLLQ